MAMATELNRPTTPRKRGYNLLITLFIFLWLVVVGFTSFSFVRERSYKVQYINNSLQHLNKTIARDYLAGRLPDEIFAENSTYYPSLRLTLLDVEGEVIYDSHPLAGHTNHAERPEVVEAIANGDGYTVRRMSESTAEEYFYSAHRDEKLVVRTALPYTAYLQKSLRLNHSFIWYVLAVTLLISAVGVVAYRRIRRDEAEIELQHERALFEQSEKIRIKRQLTNNINHELKTPVCAVKACLETLLDNPDMDSAQQRHFLEKSLSNTDRLNKLLQDVSAITRMDEAPEMIPLAPLSLRSVIEEVVGDLPQGEGRLPMRIHTHLPEGDPLMMDGNAEALKSLFGNLIDNARAYSGGRDIYITLHSNSAAPSAGGVYRLCFEDNGIGVDPEHLGALFDRFYRIDSGRSRRLGGTGLGLSIVRNSVVLHGGEIVASNRPEGGLRFDFSLKISAPTSAATLPDN